MAVDPNGTWSWKAFWKVVGAVAIVAAITVGVVFATGLVVGTIGGIIAATGATTVTSVVGIAHAAMVGAAVGGLVAGGVELSGQWRAYGAENLNLGAVAIEAFTGSLFGAIGGALAASSYMPLKVGLRIGNVLVSGLRTYLHLKNSEQKISSGEIFARVALSMAISGAFQWLFSSDQLFSKRYGSGQQFLTGLSAFGRGFSRYFSNHLLDIYIELIIQSFKSMGNLYKFWYRYWKQKN